MDDVGVVLETVFRDGAPLLFVQVVGRDCGRWVCWEVLAAGTDYERDATLSLSRAVQWWTRAHTSDNADERGYFWFDSEATKARYLAGLTAAAL